MLPTFEIHDLQYAQDYTITSAADALTVNGSATPRARIRAVFLGGYVPSVAETRTLQFSIINPAFGAYPLAPPATVALLALFRYTFVPIGYEIVLFPGEYLQARRDAATAGSTIQFYFRFVETDQPFYRWKEPQRDRMFQRRRGFPLDSIIGVGRAAISSHEGGRGGDTGIPGGGFTPGGEPVV